MWKVRNILMRVMRMHMGSGEAVLRSRVPPFSANTPA
jgi:hypothetical protein